MLSPSLQGRGTFIRSISYLFSIPIYRSWKQTYTKTQKQKSLFYTKHKIEKFQINKKYFGQLDVHRTGKLTKT